MYLDTYVFVVAIFATLSTGIRTDDQGHIQHVTIPPPSSAVTSDSRIQHVTNRLKASSPSKESSTQPIVASSDRDAIEETTISETAWTTTPTSATATEAAVTSYDATGGGTWIDPEQRSNSEAAEDDLVTANFWWGLGPIYPHLYQFKRVPHLVPIHSWNPYHDYYTYHKKYPNYP